MKSFKNQHEYDLFRAWAIEGSNIEQRMRGAWTDEEELIPEHWEKYKSKAIDWPSDFEVWQQKVKNAKRKLK